MSTFQDLEKCIKANISSPNNDIRAKAENYLRELKNNHLEQYFLGICQIMTKSLDNDIRKFSAVLLRKNLTILDNSFAKLTQNTQNNIKSLLLKQLQIEKNQNVLNEIAEVISCLSNILMQKGGWNDLMPYLVKLSSSSSISDQLLFYLCIDKLGCNSIDVLCNNNNMNNIRNLLISGLQSTNNNIRQYSLNAVVSIICNLNNENELNYFRNIVPLLFNNININISDSIICKTCQHLLILAENQPNFFSKNNCMKPIIKCLVNVSSSSKLKWETRRLSLTLLFTLLNDNYSEISNNLFEISKQIIPIVYSFLSQFDDNISWNKPEDDCDQVNFIFGSEMLIDVINLFGSEIFLNGSKPVFDAGFNSNSNWKKQLIAFKTIEVTLESCSDLYANQLNNIINIICKSLINSNNKYIKYVSLNVIKQLSIVYGCNDDINFLSKYNQPIMNSFISLLNNNNLLSQHRCVLIAICDSLAQFAYCDDNDNDDDNDNIIVKYSDNILKGLVNLLKSNDNLVQSYTLKAISVIISVINDAFEPFYNDFMSYCKNLLFRIYNNGCANDASGLLRGRLMECIGQMCVVVNINKCRNDAHEIIKYLIPFQEKEQLNNISEAYTYMMTLFASIAEALTNEFKPYLKHVIPPLIKSAQLNTVNIGNTNDQKDNNNDDNNKNIITSSFAGIKFRINTSEMNEKITACQQFPRYFVCMEGELLEFIKPISNVLLPQIKSKINTRIRRNAIETVIPIVNSLKLGLKFKNLSDNDTQKWVQEYCENEVIPALVIGLNIADSVDELILILKNILNLLDYINPNKFQNVSCISELNEQISFAINERNIRSEENEQKSIIDYDDAEIEEDVEAELEESICDLCAKLAELFGNKYIVIFDKYLGKQCINLLKNKNKENDQILSLTLLTEIINHSSSNNNIINKYIPLILSESQDCLSSKIKDSSPLLIQSVCYCIGICAMKKYLNKSNISLWLNLLKNNVIDCNNSRNNDNISATENAISAIAKILNNYNSNITNTQNIIIQWIQMLPIQNDNEERQFCNIYLCEILQKTNLLKDILNNNKKLLISKLIHICAVSIYNNDNLKNKYSDLFKHIKNNYNDKIFIKNTINNLSNNNLQSTLNNIN